MVALKKYFHELPLRIFERKINQGRFEEVTNAIEEGKLSLDDRFVSGDTLLIRECQKGNCHAAHFLIDRGVDVNAINKRGETALYFAIRTDKAELVNGLLSKGAEVKKETARKLVREQKEKVRKFLKVFSQSDLEKVFFAACEAGDYQLYLELVDKINLKEQSDEEGETVLMVAAKGKNPEILIDLAEKRSVNFFAKDRQGNTMHKYIIDEGISIDVYERLMMALSRHTCNK